MESGKILREIQSNQANHINSWWCLLMCASAGHIHTAWCLSLQCGPGVIHSANFVSAYHMPYSTFVAYDTLKTKDILPHAVSIPVRETNKRLITL